MVARLRTVVGLALLAVACQASPAPPDGRPFDVLITDGLLFDGTGAPGRRADVGLADGRIVAVGDLAGATARRRIDASGRWITPGFIDPHTHALDDLLDPERADNPAWLHQGVTTVVVGNDGGGLPDRAAALSAMQAHGIGTHVAFHAGHNRIRAAVLGGAARAATPEELTRMAALVDAEMRAGAIGLSTGLFYAPGTYSQTDEVIALARAAARHGGIYDTHLRDEARYSIGLLAAVEEALRIGREAGLPVHVAHLKALGRDAWGRATEVIQRIETARRDGQAVTADQYPYIASGTRLSAALVPRWAQADSHAAMLERFDDLASGKRLREGMTANLWRRGGAAALLITGAGAFRGRTLAEIAGQREEDAVTAAQHIIRSGDPAVASFNMRDEDLDAIAVQSWVSTGSDGSEGHPRRTSAFPQAYRTLVVERQLMDAATFVHRSSGRTAAALQLCDRGRVVVGLRADIAVIDPERYAPRADFEQPELLAAGVEWLFVSGRAALAAGVATGLRAGEVVHRGAVDARCPVAATSGSRSGSTSG